MLDSSLFSGDERAFLVGEDVKTDFLVGDSALFRGEVERDRCTLVDFTARGCRGCMVWSMGIVCCDERNTGDRSWQEEGPTEKKRRRKGSNSRRSVSTGQGL